MTVPGVLVTLDGVELARGPFSGSATSIGEGAGDDEQARHQHTIFGAR